MKKTIADNTEQIIREKALGVKLQGADRKEAEMAMAKLYARYKDPIYYLAFKFFKSDADIADEMVQEIFIKVWEKRELYDSVNAFSTWLYKIAKNHMIDYKRKEKVEVLTISKLKSEYNNTDDDSIAEKSFQLSNDSENALDIMMKEEKNAVIMDAIEKGIRRGKNIEVQKQVVTLVYLMDLSYEEVEKKTNIPVSSVRILLFRAKEQMRDYLLKSRNRALVLN